MSTEAVYREVQRFRRPTLWVVVVATALVFLAFGVSEATTLAGQLLCLFTAVGLVAGFAAMRLTTEVTNEGVVVSFPPFRVTQHIPFEEIQRVERHVYHPATPLGHWGIHVGLDDQRSFNIGGNEGVELVYGENQRLVVGSTQPSELVDVIRRMQRQERTFE
ncbi:hypothetical protein [Halogranum rubrum]|uniref:Bacterial Pleckstrin homology domain-containing protein n=1 Tax=Halogranum salarium B-1 TaxID=1210908 RepID=J2ZIH5_9EURY|nr:hypothetical protein [Halogranum salarium]EJN60515.1 hypothetical protein HSB1_11180 [Halogranum salarium B-1]